MVDAWTGRRLVSAATLGLAVAGGAWLSGQARQASVGMLDEHPSIEYASRPTTDRVSKLNAALAQGSRSLQRDARTGYLLPVLQALGVPDESQLLVFSKTGVQRDYTGPRNPRALFFDQSVVVGYIPGAPVLELAAHDPQQGVVFYTLDQTAPSAPAFTRQTTCITCHVSASTLDVPGMIARSNMVDQGGSVMPQLGSATVNHRTDHTARWGGWFVTTNTEAPPYSQLGNLGNVTVSVNPSAGTPIFSNTVLIEWLNSDPESRGYLSSASDLAALMVFDHQMHAINLLTRLNWEARVAASAGRAGVDGPLVERVRELADYLLFVDEAPPLFEVTPRAGFAERLESRFPKDRQGRSFGQLDLSARLLRYPCSYMVYSEAFDGLPPAIKDALYRRMFDVLSGKGARGSAARLAAGDRRAIMEILRDTKPDLPADLRASGTR